MTEQQLNRVIAILEESSIPCTGHNSGQCIGLAEEAQAAGPQAVPESTVGHSPTVYGGV